MGWWTLPDELWRRILEIGTASNAPPPPPPRFTYKDLCCLSITCRRLRRLSSEDSLWSSLLLSDFPPPPSDASTNSTHTTSTSSSSSQIAPAPNSSSSSSYSSFKALYKIRYERNREQKRLAHRRIILRIESEIAESSRKIREMELHSAQEREKMRITVAELLNLHRVSYWYACVPSGKHRLH